jgi:hypothetical protein
MHKILKEMSAEERKAFENISWSIGKGGAHPLEDIKGTGVAKDKIVDYMSKFVEKGLYVFDGENYTITGTGKDAFREIQDLDVKRSALGRLVY